MIHSSNIKINFPRWKIGKFSTGIYKTKMRKKYEDNFSENPKSKYS